ncbi:MAG: AtpZ/AtpI family protein [Tissierellia bacterium]|nr:AtpZ/AtpI family protein [Tissierellia bacterium]
MSKMSNKDKKQEPKNGKTFRGLAHFSQIAATMITTVLGSVFVGKYLDTKFNTSPWLLLVFSLFGVGYAIKMLFDLGKK